MGCFDQRSDPGVEFFSQIVAAAVFRDGFDDGTADDYTVGHAGYGSGVIRGGDAETDSNREVGCGADEVEVVLDVRGYFASGTGDTFP